MLCRSEQEAGMHRLSTNRQVFLKYPPESCLKQQFRSACLLVCLLQHNKWGI